MGTATVKTPARKPRTVKAPVADIAPITPVTKPSTTFTAEDRIGMSFEYDEVATPVATRTGTAEANPHTTGVAKAIENMKAGKNTALGFSVATDDAIVKRNLAWLRTEGTKQGVTIRISQAADEATGKTRITFWAIEKITRARKAVEPTGEPVPDKTETGF